MSIRYLLDWAQKENAATMTGLVASEFYQLYDDADNWVWSVDIDIGKDEVLRKVPIATNNRDIFFAEIGKAVTLQKTGKDKWIVTGLAKTSVGLKHIIFMSFTDDISEIVSEEWTGYTIRLLTFGELGTIEPFGSLPFGAIGKFNSSDGSFVELIS